MVVVKVQWHSHQVLLLTRHHFIVSNYLPCLHVSPVSQYLTHGRCFAVTELKKKATKAKDAGVTKMHNTWDRWLSEYICFSYCWAAC